MDMNKKRKGFTLMELIAVLVILSLIALVVTPIVVTLINNSKNKLHDEQVNRLEKAATKYITENDLMFAKDSRTYSVMVSTLKTNGYIQNEDVLDPKTGEEMGGCIAVAWDGDYNDFNVEYVTDCSGTLDISGPVVNLTAIRNGTTVEAEANAIDPDETAITKYEFAIDGGSYVDNGTNTTYTFSSVNTDAHVVSARVTNAAGRSTVATTTVGTNSWAVPEFHINQEGWQKFKTVTIDYKEFVTGLTYKYKINSEDEFPVSGSLKSNPTVTFNDNGIIQAIVTDSVETQTVTFNVTGIDSSVPMISFTPNGNASNAKEVSVILTVSDTGSGLLNNQTLYYGWSTGGAPTVWQQVNLVNELGATSTTVSLTSPVVSGEYYLWIKAGILDQAGNENALTRSNKFYFDNTGPTCTISGNPTSWVCNATLVVNSTATDLHGTLPYSWTSSTSGFGLTASKAVTSNGAYTAYAQDAIGNVGSCNAVVNKIDDVLPTNVAVTEISKTTSTITVGTTATDAGIGIIKYEYNIDDTGYIDNGSTSTYTFTGLTAGTHSVKVRVTDGCGNAVVSPTRDISTNTMSSPSFAINPSSGWATQKVVTINYPSGSGLIYTYSKDGGAYVTATQTQTVTFTANGSLTARAYDGVNTVSASYNVTGIDTTPPSKPILSSSSSNYNSITATYGTSTDSESGISGYTCYYGVTSNPTSVGSVSGTTCTFSSLSSSTTYYFKMCATNGASLTTCSDVSNKATTQNLCSSTIESCSYGTPTCGTCTSDCTQTCTASGTCYQISAIDGTTVCSSASSTTTSYPSCTGGSCSGCYCLDCASEDFVCQSQDPYSTYTSCMQDVPTLASSCSSCSC